MNTSVQGESSQGACEPIRDVFQVLIRDDAGLPTEFPAHVEANIQSVRGVHPEAAYHLLGGEQVRSFIAAHFSSDVVATYDTLAPYSYKCDLARFCLLLVHGGLYMDIGIRFLMRLEPPSGTGLVAFRDLLHACRNSWGLNSGLLFATADRPELRTAIDLIVQNCKDRYYGATPLDPTGPSLFGRAVAMCNNSSDYWLGETRMTTPELANKNIAFVTLDGRLLALRSKTGNIDDLGLNGTNNYNIFWHARQAYGERTRRFDTSSMSAGVGIKSRDGILIERGAQGCAIHGPYTSLAAGRYRIDLWFDRNTKLGRSTLDICANAGINVIKLLQSRELKIDKNGRLTFELETRSDLAKVEVRLHVNGDCEGRFLRLEVT